LIYLKFNRSLKSGLHQHCKYTRLKTKVNCFILIYPQYCGSDFVKKTVRRPSGHGALWFSSSSPAVVLLQRQGATYPLVRRLRPRSGTKLGALRELPSKKTRERARPRASVPTSLGSGTRVFVQNQNR